MRDDLDPAVRAWLGDAAVPVAMARAAAPGAPCVVVLGAGFSGTLAAAQLIRQATRPIHVVVVDRAAAFAAGVAYSTADPRHLLNVPAARMSAWPDRADSFAAWAKARDPEASPDDFRPRRDYAAYLRDELIATANAAAPGVSLALRHADVRAVDPRPGGGFVVEPAHAAPGAAAIAADAVVIATGHRAPRDPLAERWRGPRTRFIADPWPSLEPFAIAGDEPVVVLGSGLSAIDAVLTLTRGPRSAPIVCVSRHGLLTRDHAPASAPPPPHVDLAPAIERWRAAPTLGGLVAVIRRAIDDAGAWRPVIDAVRPHTARIWAALPVDDAAAFLRHVRPLWEVHRHRMAPSVAAIVDHHARAGTFRVVAGRVTRVDATATSATLEVAQRGGGACTLAASWVVNCTGPGSHHTPAPPIAGLIAAGALEADPLGLGVVTGERGEAIAGGRPRDDLFVIGTLCKPRLWESTAVPELRAQAEIVARAVVAARGRVK